MRGGGKRIKCEEGDERKGGEWGRRINCVEDSKIFEEKKKKRKSGKKVKCEREKKEEEEE